MCASADPRAALAELEADYEILDELGRGGSAIVFRARDRALGREVAIKVLRAQPHEDAEAVARLEREARTVAQLQHPNIVTLYGIRRLRDDRLALIMQLVPGRSLREWLAEHGALSWSDAERILVDVAAALSSAHDAGIVHRDVKPENIYLDAATGRAMLSDFGVARAIDSASSVTLPGSAIGTPAYMSPEQIDGAAPDARSDLYSLGLVGWELLSGRRPWDGESLYRIIFKQKREQLEPVDNVRSDVPPRLSYSIETLLEKNPDRRWGSARIFLAELPSAAPPEGWRRWRAERRRRLRSQSFDAARERGASIMGAALETVRFQRSEAASAPAHDGATAEATPHPAPDLDASAAPALAASAASLHGTSAGRETTAPSATRRGNVASDDVRVHVARGRASRWQPGWMLAALVLVAAGVGAATYLNRNDSTGISSNLIVPAEDGRGVEVPVAPADPRVPPTVAGSDTLDSAAAAGALAGADSLAQADSLTRPLIAAGGTAVLPLDSAAANSTAPGTATDTAAATAARQRAADSVAAVTSAAARQRAADSIAAVRTATARRRAADSTAAVRAATAASRPRVDSTTFADVNSRSSGADASTPEAALAPSVTFASARGRVVAGGRHSCLLTDVGISYCWGGNDRGQLGTTLERGEAAPSAVAGGRAFAQIAAGVSHTCGVNRTGEVFCWGDNSRGQLGDGTRASRNAPTATAVPRAVRSLVAGRARTCALARDGSAWCWGADADDTSGDDSALPDRIALDGAAGAIAVGWQHACAILVSGVVQCWGSNESGQLGNGGVAAARSPLEILSTARFTSIAAGATHTCAVSTANAVWCWGRNTNGQLGTGDRQNRATPVKITVHERVRSVVAGSVHTCALSVSGTAWCWGRNSYGQLGDGTTVDSDRPVRVSGAPPFTQLSAGGAHVCGATATGATWCWGYNVEGQLGDGTRENRARPVRVTGSPSE
ncbi:MAG TPA: protein kinase [Gemmatimonadaceae bacterium]|nr:protein kinase [Gemmatimonadaceae bacterium]